MENTIYLIFIHTFFVSLVLLYNGLHSLLFSLIKMYKTKVRTYVTGFGKTDHLCTFIVSKNKFEQFTKL